jgi:hypothetical protein
MELNSKIVIALVVLVTVAAHVAIYRWVRFKVHEGVILKYLRAQGEHTGADYGQTESIAQHTEISPRRVVVVCRKSLEICAASGKQGSWRAQQV